MDHRGIEYNVRQAAERDRWYWSIQSPDWKPIHGIARSRPLAVAAAKQAIDKLLKQNLTRFKVDPDTRA